MKQKKKQQKKTGRYGNVAAAVIIVILVIAVLGAGVMYFFSRGSEASNTSVSVDLYFYSNETSTWESERRNFDTADEKQMLADVINALYDGPNDSALSPSIPAEVQIDVKYSENLKYVEIQFSENYNDTSVVTAAEDLICRGSITMTLTGLSFVDNVHFYIGDEEILTSSGQPIGDMNSENIVVTPEVEPEKSVDTSVTVYFPDMQGMGLVAEEREVTVTDSKSKQQCIVEELIAGPESSELYSPFPPDTKLLSISVDTTICFVNFSSDLLTKVSGGSTGENMLLYSLVNSLTEDGDVKKVQLQFDGDKVSEASGFNTDLSMPLERDTSYILE